MTSTTSSDTPPSIAQWLRGEIRRRSRRGKDGFSALSRPKAPRGGGAGRRGMAMLHKLADRDPARALALVRQARRVSLGSAFLAQAEAILTARSRGWAAAAPLFRAALAVPPGTGAGILRGRAAPALALALPAPERPAAVSAEVLARCLVYATAFGAEPAPLPVHAALPGLRFLLLTDRPERTVEGWQTVPVAPETADPALAGPWCRILAHRALAAAAPDAEVSLCLGPGRRLVGNLDTLLGRWLLPTPLVLWRHPAGIDWWDLIEAYLVGDPVAAAAGWAGEADPETVLAQAQDCEARQLPRNAGACDTGMIWRRHDAPEVVRLMEAWWAALAAAPGLEAVALYAALEDPAVPPPLRPHILPAALGPAGDNAFVAVRSALWRPAQRSLAAPARIGGPLPVAIVYAEPYATSASTVLRGRQLSELVVAQDPDRYDMRYTSDIAGLSDRVVVLTKGALEVHSAPVIAELRARNIAVAGSWDDMLPDPEKVAATSASMTVSQRQTTDFIRLFPGVPAYHVTHHVNTEVRPVPPPTDRLRTGYFGLLRNTWRPDSLGGIIDLVGVSTAEVEMSWLDRLPDYNCHWIVRRRGKTHDGWKPFLKGFLAARCGAVVVAMRDDDDAAQYLGDDYPFYVRGPNPALLEYDMAGVAAAFGGPDWTRALAIMAQVAARSTNAVVAADFGAMVRDLAG